MLAVAALGDHDERMRPKMRPPGLPLLVETFARVPWETRRAPISLHSYVNLTTLNRLRPGVACHEHGTARVAFCQLHGTTWIASYGTTRRVALMGPWFAR
jgi:hypothetical protein